MHACTHACQRSGAWPRERLAHHVELGDARLPRAVDSAQRKQVVPNGSPDCTPPVARNLLVAPQAQHGAAHYHRRRTRRHGSGVSAHSSQQEGGRPCDSGLYKRLRLHPRLARQRNGPNDRPRARAGGKAKLSYA